MLEDLEEDVDGTSTRLASAQARALSWRRLTPVR
jgi:hypothetical protein